MNTKQPRNIELKINEQVIIDDSLSLVLIRFSHKPSPEIGKAERGTAHITALFKESSEEILLSVHGIAGTLPNEDGLTDSQRYDTIRWNEYILQLKSFLYNKSITITISKK